MAQKPSLVDKYRAAPQPQGQRGNLIDDTLGSAMKLSEIMNVLEKRDAEKNKGWFGIDRRTIDEVTRGAMQGEGKFEDIVGSIGPSLARSDARRAGDVKNQLTMALSLGQEAQKQRRLEEQKIHELERDDKRFEHDYKLQSMRETAADKRAGQLLTKQKDLELFKQDLKLNPRKYLPQDISSNSLEESNLRPITSLSRPEMTLYAKEMKEIQTTGKLAGAENRYLHEASKIVDRISGLGGIAKSMTPQEFQSAFGNEQQTLLNRLDKINSLMFQARVARAKAASGTGKVTDAERAIINKGLPSSKVTSDANKALIEAKRRENQLDVARLKYYTEKQFQGFEPNEIGFMASKAGQQAFREADIFGEEGEEESIESMEEELAKLKAAQKALES